MRYAMTCLALALLLSSCAAPSTPAPAPTAQPKSTALATATAEFTPAVILAPSGEAAETAAAQPTPTVAPPATPLPTGTFTPIVLFFLPTLTITPTPAAAFDCALLQQSVENGSTFKPGERFSMGWQVQNTGAAPWYPGSVVFAFVGGSKLHLYPQVNLQGSVPPGMMTTLSADLRAPKNPSKYSTFWSLHQGDTWFCRVRVTIIVEP